MTLTMLLQTCVPSPWWQDEKDQTEDAAMWMDPVGWLDSHTEIFAAEIFVGSSENRMGADSSLVPWVFYSFLKGIAYMFSTCTLENIYK